MKTIRKLISRNADRLFAGFALIGSLLITKAGNYADNNGDASNIYLTASGLIEIVAQIVQLTLGARARPFSAPLYIVGGFAMFASGIALAGLSMGSVEEAITGLLMACGAFFIFYGDPLLKKSKLSGPFVGGWLYNVSCVPLLIAGFHHQNPFEAGCAISFIIGNTCMALKGREGN